MLSSPDIVRSLTQRALLEHWGRLRPPSGLPPWCGLPQCEPPIPDDDLSFTQVVGDEGQRRFRIAFHGARVAVTYGRVDCTGKFLDEVLPAAYRAAALSSYHQVVNDRHPVYTVADMRDVQGRIVHYERLLLPFTAAGAGVDRIIASLETTSPEGAFERQALLRAPERTPAFALCTTIRF